MIRLALSILGGFILLYVQSLIVMYMNGYSNIQFSNLNVIFMIWATNVIILFGFLSDFKFHLLKTAEKEE